MRLGKRRTVTLLAPQELYSAMGFPAGAHGAEQNPKMTHRAKVLLTTKIVDVTEIEKALRKGMEESVK